MHPLEVKIIESIARTLFVTTYADAWENNDLFRMIAEDAGYRMVERSVHGAPFFAAYLRDARLQEAEGDTASEVWEEVGSMVAEDEGIEVPYASAGSDWMDVAPETPFPCFLIAAQEVGAYLQRVRMFVRPRDHVSLLGLLREAALADGLLTGDDVADHYHVQLGKLTDRRGSYAESFGHCLAMMWAGSEVSWFDDHKESGLPEHSASWATGIALEDLGFTVQMLRDL